jgi:hypothetical protein
MVSAHAAILAASFYAPPIDDSSARRPPDPVGRMLQQPGTCSHRYSSSVSVGSEAHGPGSTASRAARTTPGPNQRSWAHHPRCTPDCLSDVHPPQPIRPIRSRAPAPAHDSAAQPGRKPGRLNRTAAPYGKSRSVTEYNLASNHTRLDLARPTSGHRPR